MFLDGVAAVKTIDVVMATVVKVVRKLLVVVATTNLPVNQLVKQLDLYQ